MSIAIPGDAPHPLGRLLRPRSIAVVGVKGGAFEPTARDSMSRRFLELLLRSGYQGAVYPVNPRYDTVAGLPCFPSISAVPEPFDLALVLVPKARVAQTIEECGARGVKLAVVITSGFGELGEEGRAEEQDLLARARRLGVRLLGPNCFGYLGSHDHLNLFGSASLLTRPLLRGAIGFVTQSGALAAAIVDRAQERGIAFSHVITTGNQADVDNAECLEFLADDRETRVLALFAESLAPGERFRAAVRRAAARGKPCVVLKSGASALGRAVALAHTGSLAGDDAVCDAVFRAEGVLRCEEPDELFEIAALLAVADPDPGTGRMRIAVVTMSGAMGGVLADAAARCDVPVADLSPATRATLLAMPGVTGSLNPLDAAMATWAGEFGVVGEIAGILARDPGVDAVVLAISGLPYAERLIDDCAAATHGAGKVFVPIWAADQADTAKALARLAAMGVVVYGTPGSALRALHGLGAHRRHQLALREVVEPTGVPRVDEARRRAALALLARCGPQLTEVESKELLALYGVPVPLEVVASSSEEAAAAAERIGYPVALKVHSADLPHKSEAGGVALGLSDGASVRAAFARILASARAHAPQARLAGVLVAPMARPGLEVIVGGRQDPQFGPVVMLGTGGIFVEVMRDVTLRPAPVTEAEAVAMPDELRGRALWSGARGLPPADRRAAAQVLLGVSALLVELRDEVSEIDVNPLVVYREGQGVTVVDALVIRGGHAADDPPA